MIQLKTYDSSTDQLFEIFINDAKKPFSGWDFSHLRDRMVTEPLSWSYTSEILPFIRTVKSCLDMGTGGGEFLASLQPLPKKTFATEAYQPNVQIARERLDPIGVKVKEISDQSHLPFTDESFELIINRHEAYSPQEVNRILKHEGLFITQQVGAKNDLELNYLLNKDFTEDLWEYSYWNLKYAKKELEDAGFKIIKTKEDFPKTRIFDIGAIVYYFKAAPWQMPDFTIEKYLKQLREIHKKIMEKGYIEITSHRFLIKCKK
jgi:SAM-dependent methyltransferase